MYAHKHTGPIVGRVGGFFGTDQPQKLFSDAPTLGVLVHGWRRKSRWRLRLRGKLRPYTRYTMQ